MNLFDNNNIKDTNNNSNSTNNNNNTSQNNITSPQKSGVLYEAQVVQLLNEPTYNFHVHQTIHSHDQGIDFKGEWLLPMNELSLTNFPIKIIGQCKKEKDPIGVKAIREFEGVLSHHNMNHMIGVFVSYSGYTEFAIRHAVDAKFPLILCKISNEPLILTYFLLNEKAQQLIPNLSVSVLRISEGMNKIVFH
ncbi:hypothetical protein ABK040_008572 [Willaertia magna]